MLLQPVLAVGAGEPAAGEGRLASSLCAAEGPPRLLLAQAVKDTQIDRAAKSHTRMMATDVRGFRSALNLLAAAGRQGLRGIREEGFLVRVLKVG
jgi:hypothetical protein